MRRCPPIPDLAHRLGQARAGRPRYRRLVAGKIAPDRLTLRRTAQVIKTPTSEEGVLSIYFLLQNRQPAGAELKKILTELHGNKAGRLDVIRRVAWSTAKNQARGSCLHALRAATMLLRLTGVAWYARRRRAVLRPAGQAARLTGGKAVKTPVDAAVLLTARRPRR